MTGSQPAREARRPGASGDRQLSARHTLLVRRGPVVGRAIRRRQAGRGICDEQPAKKHGGGNRKQPKRTAGEVLTTDANGTAGRDANEEQRNAAQGIRGGRHARRSGRGVARCFAVQHERFKVRAKPAPTVGRAGCARYQASQCGPSCCQPIGVKGANDKADARGNKPEPC